MFKTTKRFHALVSTNGSAHLILPGTGLRELEHVLVHNNEGEGVTVGSVGIAGKGAHSRHAACLGNDTSTHGFVAHAAFKGAVGAAVG